MLEEKTKKQTKELGISQSKHHIHDVDDDEWYDCTRIEFCDNNTQLMYIQVFVP